MTVFCFKTILILGGYHKCTRARGPRNPSLQHIKKFWVLGPLLFLLKMFIYIIKSSKKLNKKILRIYHRVRLALDWNWQSIWTLFNFMTVFCCKTILISECYHKCTRACGPRHPSLQHIEKVLRIRGINFVVL